MRLVIDTETTGLCDITDRVIEIAIMDLDGEVYLHTRVNPEQPIPIEITNITGIRDQDVVDAPKFSDIAPEVTQLIVNAEVWCGQNPWFDKRMIVSELKRLSVDLLSMNVPRMICTKRLWDHYEPRDERHLQNAYKRFVDPSGFDGAHGALADTEACRKVLLSQLVTFGLIEKPPEQWDPEQATWWGPSSHVVWKDGTLFINFGKHRGIACHAVDRGYWNWLSGQDFPKHVIELACFVLSTLEPVTESSLASWAYGRKYA